MVGDGVQLFVTVLFTTPHPHLSGDLVISISLLAGQFGGGDRSLLSREKSTNMRTLIALSLAISAAAAQVELRSSSDLRKLKYLSLPGTLGPPPELHAGRLPAGDFKGIRQLHVRDRRELVHQEGKLGQNNFLPSDQFLFPSDRLHAVPHRQELHHS